jgi:trehalose-6-phosphate synthase
MPVERPIGDPLLHACFMSRNKDKGCAYPPRLLVMSNRLPITAVKDMASRESVAGISQILSGFPRTLASILYYLSKETIDRFCQGVCNAAIWPIFHCSGSSVTYDESFWRCYMEASQNFYDVTMEALRSDNIIWTHGYRLMLLLRLL